MLNLCTLATSIAIAVAAPFGPEFPTTSATTQAVAPKLLARDINGFELDMDFRQVAARVPQGLEPLGLGEFRATVAGVEYDFGFTPLGRLYRINSSQLLGSFVPDGSFGAELTRRLAVKYGNPHNNQLPGGPAFWTYAETYTANGMELNRETESFSAMLSGGYGLPIALTLKLMDFRILRRDEAAMNSKPQSAAGQTISF